ncbi:hypothetical protein M3J09_008533 [Ascochyta lentis]
MVFFTPSGMLFRDSALQPSPGALARQLSATSEFHVQNSSPTRTNNPSLISSIVQPHSREGSSLPLPHQAPVSHSNDQPKFKHHIPPSQASTVTVGSSSNSCT